jgi:BirA family biotin operon repressor/biotin-[acetyl-CoA-carboxylase] ligase
MENELTEAQITKGLNTRTIGQKVIYYEKLTSTMDAARQAAGKGAAEGTIVIAEEQTNGRGRLKRVWLTSHGSIAVSIILKPQISQLHSLIMIASLAAMRAIRSATGLKSQIKWPNDNLIRGRKVCGILIESEIQRKEVKHSIIGIGINVNLNIADFPEIKDIATSLSEETGRRVLRLSVVSALLVELERLYLDTPQEAVFNEWRDNLITLGQRVRVTADKTVYEGLAETVDKDGSLMLRLPDGSLIRMVAGDVTLRG